MIILRALFVATSIAALPAQAFTLDYYRVVHEYFDGATGHYRLGNPNGSPPANWNPTGYSFYASGTTPPQCCAQPVRKFRAPSSGAEVFTANPAEIAVLSAPGSGWDPVPGEAFRIPVPQAGGACAAGLDPVHRYSIGTPTGSRHRYVVTAAQRSRMTALGWIDEGVTFCAHDTQDEPLSERYLEYGFPLPDERCAEGTCIAARNVRTPSISANSEAFFPSLFALTGLHAATAWGMAPGIPADRSFVQVTTRSPDRSARARSVYGIHLNGTERSSGLLASLSPTSTFDLGGRERPTSGMFVPFRTGYDTDVELRIAFQAFVRTVNAAPGSHAYALPVVELRDATTDLRILLSVQAFGTVPPGDGIGREEGTGKVIVSTTFRPAPAFGRSLGLDFLATPAPFLSAHPWGHGGDFDFRLTRADFVTMLGMARTIEPRLSADPQHYQVARFQFRVETFGDATIGLHVYGARLELLRR